MNILIALDNCLLDLTKKISGKVYQLCGISHIEISKFLLILSLSLVMFVLLMLAWVMFLSFVSFFCLLLIIVFGKLGMSVWTTIVANQIMTKPGTLNISREKLRWMRFALLVFALFLVVKTIGQNLFSGSPLLFVLIIVLSPGVHFLLFSVGLYFGSIEPEPPSQSKFKKFIGAVKEFFSTGALPQPG